MIKKGELYKHFKGSNLDEKNIYKILEVGVIYSGEKFDGSETKMVVYENIFQNKVFVRELDDLIMELPKDKQIQYGQIHRIEKLTDDEVEYIESRIKNI